MSETTVERKGLSAWIKTKAGQGTAPSEHGVAALVDIDLLDDNPKQPRRDYNEDAMQELMRSLVLFDQMQPCTVTKQPDGRYTIIAGHRRKEARKRLRDAATTEEERARWSKVPVTDRGPTASDQLAELALTENLLRDDLRPIETAEALGQLKEARSLETAEDVAKALGLELTKTKRYLQLASAPQAIRTALSQGLMVEVGGDTAGGKPKREHRTLDLAHSIVVLRAHKHWNKTKPKKAAELTRSLVDQVLREGWPLKKVQEHVDRLIGKAEAAAAPGEDAQSLGESDAARQTKRLFVTDDKRLVVNRSRLAEAPEDEKKALRATLQELLAAL